jgi:hypothetical protein
LILFRAGNSFIDHNLKINLLSLYGFFLNEKI